MKSKAQKSVVIKDLSKKMSESDMIVFTSFSREGEKGLSVAKMRELKRGLRKLGAEYVVAKKNLISLAVRRSYLEKMVDADSFEGSVGLVLSGREGDGTVISKNIYEFTKSHPVFRILGAIFEKQYFDLPRFVGLAKLPPKEVLRARALGMMQYPLTGLVSVLSGNLRSLVAVLSNIKK